MKILIIYNKYLYRGGEDTYIEGLINLLENKGHKAIFYLKDSKNIQTIIDKIKTAVGLFFNKKTAIELSKIIKKEKPDIAHFHNIYPLIGATAYRICKKFNVPIVQHIHNYRFVCPKANLFRNGKICETCPKNKTLLPAVFFGCYYNSRLASFFFALSFLFHRLIGSYKFIDKYIFPSLFTQKYYQTHLGLERAQIEYVPYFVDLPKNILRLPNTPKNYYLYLGRLTQEKGITKILEIFKGKRIKLLIIGDGPLRNYITRKYLRFKNIIFIPFQKREKVFSYLKYCKALIMPSEWYEVSPMVIIEAYLMKKIPIFPLIGGMTERKNMGLGIKPEFYYKYITTQINTKSDKKINYQDKRAKIFNSHYHYQKFLKIYSNLKKSKI